MTLDCGLGVDLQAFPLEGTSAELERLTRCLSPQERGRAERLVFERDRRRFVMARGRLRHLLASRLGVDPGTVEIVTGPEGKPRLAGDEIHFNLSRSGDLALCALSSDREIGVDIEACRPVPEADAIVERFFTPSEIREYRALPSQKRLEGFLNGWTRKEALLKAQGRGLGGRREDWDVPLAPLTEPALFRTGSSEWVLEALVPAPGYVGAVVIPS